MNIYRWIRITTPPTEPVTKLNNILNTAHANVLDELVGFRMAMYDINNNKDTIELTSNVLERILPLIN